jgi:hypothetical protein
MDEDAGEERVHPVSIGNDGKQEFRRTDFGTRLLAAEGERGGGEVCLK